MVKKAKPQARGKKQLEKSPKEHKEKVLAKVPVEYTFWCHDGSVFSNLQELAKGLEAMSDEIFAYHSNSDKQDFSNWVRDVIRDEMLAYELAQATSRMQAIDYVTARLAMLSG